MLALRSTFLTVSIYKAYTAPHFLLLTYTVSAKFSKNGKYSGKNSQPSNVNFVLNSCIICCPIFNFCWIQCVENYMADIIRSVQKWFHHDFRRQSKRRHLVIYQSKSQPKKRLPILVFKSKQISLSQLIFTKEKKINP